MAQGLRAEHLKSTPAHVKKQRLNPDSPVGFEGEIPTGHSKKYARFLSECSELMKHPECFCEEGPFWWDRENMCPDALDPFVFHAAYNDVALQEHYKHSSRLLKDWLKEAYRTHPETLEKLLSQTGPRPLAKGNGKGKGSARPLASSGCQLKDADDAITNVLGLFSKFQFEYRRPCRRHSDAPMLDTWSERPTWDINDDHPIKLQHTSLCVTKEAFGESYLKEGLPCDGISVWSAFGDVIYSMLSQHEHQLYSRTVVGIPFPLYCYAWHDSMDALRIEKAWEELPILRQGKPTRGCNSGRVRRKAASDQGQEDVGHWRRGSSWKSWIERPRREG